MMGKGHFLSLCFERRVMEKTNIVVFMPNADILPSKIILRNDISTNFRGYIDFYENVCNEILSWEKYSMQKRGRAYKASFS